MSKSVVFIDGNNFYFKLKELKTQIDGDYSLLEFDFSKFAEWLVGSNKLVQVEILYRGPKTAEEQ